MWIDGTTTSKLTSSRKYLCEKACKGLDCLKLLKLIGNSSNLCCLCNFVNCYGKLFWIRGNWKGNQLYENPRSKFA